MMNLDEVIDLFLKEQIKADEVSHMFEKGKLTIENINNQYEFAKLIQKLNQKYSNVMKKPVILPYDYSWQDTIISLMFAIENRKDIEDVANSSYIHCDNCDY